MKKLLLTLIILTVTAALFSCGVSVSDDEESIGSIVSDTAEKDTESENSDKTEAEEATEISPEDTLPIDINTLLHTSTYVRSNGEFEYTVDKGEVTIVRYVGKKIDVTVPSEIEGMPVVKLGHWILNHGIHGIFDETNVRYLTVPGSVYMIDEYALGGNVKIEKLVLMEGVNRMFSAPDTLKEITIPESFNIFGYNILNRCERLKTIYYYGEPSSLKNILDQAGSSELFWRDVYYYIPEYERFLTSVFDLTPEMWQDKEFLKSIKTLLSKHNVRAIVSRYAKALHPDSKGNHASLAISYPFELLLCTSSESYDIGGWDIAVRWDVIEVSFFEDIKKYYAYFTVNGDFFHIEEAADGTVYTKEYVLELVKSDKEFENCVLSKKSENTVEHDERIISVNISKLPEIEAIITQYPRAYGYDYSIDFYVDPASDDSLIGKLVVNSETDQYYYSFSLDVTDFSVSDIRTHSTPEEILRFVGDPYPEYVEPNYDILYESEKLIVYHAEESTKSDVFVKNKITGKEFMIYDGMTREEKADPTEFYELDEIYHVTVFDERYIIYNLYNDDMISGFGIFDAETGDSYYSNEYKFLRLCSDRVFVSLITKVSPPFNQDMCYTILDGSGEFVFHDVINADEMFVDARYYSISPNGKKIVSSSSSDAITDLPIKISDVDGGDIEEYSISRYPSCSLINDKYYFRYDSSNFYLDSYLLIIPLD